MMSNNIEVKVSDFTEYPGPRLRKTGPSSGEEFRDDYLIPKLNDHGKNIIVNLDGVIGYGSSFLEETFGGAVRKGIDQSLILHVVDTLICNDEKTLKEEIRGYVDDALRKRNSK